MCGNRVLCSRASNPVSCPEASLGKGRFGIAKGVLMRSVAFSALVFAIALTGLSGTAAAQDTTQPPGVLFFEGDIVRHRLDGQIGPWCVLASRFKRGEGIAWRMRTMTPDGANADDSVISSLVVELGNGDSFPLVYGPHGNPPTDFFWASSYTIPESYPTGSLGYRVLATMNDGTVVTWEPFTRPNSLLWVIDGEPDMADNAPYEWLPSSGN